MNKWYKKAIVYQIYPMTFKDSNHDGIGDLKGIIEKIPYLKELGINAIWLSPIYPSPMNDNGYDIADYKAINPMFGDMNDFDELIKILHQNGIKLIMDLVVNHTSSLHYWFQEAIKNKESKYHNYYIFRDKPNNWTSFFGGSAWCYNIDTNDYYLHLFDKSQPDLNWENNDVREEIKDILRYWLDKGVDGFRCDVINLISKEEGLPDGNEDSLFIGIEHYANGKKLHSYLRELYEDVFKYYDAYTIGECGMLSIEEALKLTNQELDMVFNFEHFSVDSINSKWNIKSFKFSEFKAIFNKWQEYYNKYNFWNSLLLENHDQPRSASRYTNKDYLFESLTMLKTYVYLQCGTPYIYQGEEIGMMNYPFKSIDDFQDVESINYYNENKDKIDNKDLIKRMSYISRDNARSVMQWDNTYNSGFSDVSTNLLVNPNYLSLNVLNDLKSDKSIYKYFQKLLRLRKDYDVLIKGLFKDLDPLNDDLFIYKRYNIKYAIYVIGNNQATKKKIPLPFKKYQLLLSNYEVDSEEFYPYQVKVYLVKEEEHDH